MNPFAERIIPGSLEAGNHDLKPERIDGDFQLNLGVKYDIPSINLALFASITDLLDTYKLSYTLDTPALKQKVEKRRNPRIIYVGLSWNFGGASKKQHHDVEYDEEM